MNPRLAPASAPARLLGLLVLPALAGCALLSSPGAPRPDDAFEAGLDRLDEGRHAEAVRALASTARACGMQPLGQQATLTLAVLELDPRYPDGSPERAARISLHLLEEPDRAPWTGRIAASLYLLAVDRRLGTSAVEPASAGELYLASDRAASVEDCGPRLAGGARDTIRRPELPGPATAARNALLRERVRRLEAEVERLRSLLETPDPDAR